MTHSKQAILVAWLAILLLSILVAAFFAGIPVQVAIECNPNR